MICIGNKPLISIVTVSLNQGEFIERNIKSVLNQKYSPIEHIIIDGASTDQTVSILKKYPHLNWISEADSGQAEALNKGIQKARGSIISILNSDDYFEDNVFESVMGVFQKHPDTKIVFGDCSFSDESGNVLYVKKGKFISFNDYASFFRKSNIQDPTIFHKRELFEEFGLLDESFDSMMTLDFYFRVFKKYRPYYLPQKLAYYRLHHKSKTIIEHLAGYGNTFFTESIKIRKKYWQKEWGSFRMSLGIYLIHRKIYYFLAEFWRLWFPNRWKS